MFELVSVPAAPVAHRLWGTCAGVTCQALLVGGMILAPMIFPGVLPQVGSLIYLVAPGPPPPAPPPGLKVRVRPATLATHVYRCDLCAPVAVPARVATIVDEPPEATEAGVPGGTGVAAAGVNGGVIGSILAEVPAMVPPPRPVEVARPASVAPASILRVRVGGLVKPAVPIVRVDPVYPALARQARVAGVVELEGVIGMDGRIHELRIRSGHPLLVKAAVDAVTQWVYAPTTLNGSPVEVVMPITVTFHLN